MSDQKKEKAQFLPWSAINAFMLQEFQIEVLNDVLGNYESLTSELRTSLNQMIKRSVKLNGFRNATIAPLSLRVHGSIELFEKNAHFAYLVLSSWSLLHLPLRDAVHKMLTDRAWLLLPADVDRSNIPGFLARWPKEDEFDVLTPAFRELYPDLSQFTDNQISLMAVWVSGRLPYELIEKSNIDAENEEESS